jgi:solute carrier family 8 (sodium/calcium exchanger)
LVEYIKQLFLFIIYLLFLFFIYYLFTFSIFILTFLFEIFHPSIYIFSFIRPEDCNPLEEKKFMVSSSKLLELFNTCKKCNRLATASIQHIIGTMVKIKAECDFCCFTWQWCSQPYLGSIPAGNIGLSASILFSGAIATKVLRVLECMGVATISRRTFTSHQSAILFPAISRVWDKRQREYIARAEERNQPLVIGGDGRADSPGHCAKFGSYSTIDLEHGTVIDIKLVQVN